MPPVSKLWSLLPCDLLDAKSRNAKSGLESPWKKRMHDMYVYRYMLIAKTLLHVVPGVETRRICQTATVVCLPSCLPSRMTAVGHFQRQDTDLNGSLV